MAFQVSKEPTFQWRRHKRHSFDSWIGKIPWRRAWQPTPVFSPGESHGQRNLAGYSPWGHKELEKTEATQHAQWIHQRNYTTCSTLGQVLQSTEKCFVMRKPAYSQRFWFNCFGVRPELQYFVEALQIILKDSQDWETLTVPTGSKPGSQSGCGHICLWLSPDYKGLFVSFKLQTK